MKIDLEREFPGLVFALDQTGQLLYASDEAKRFFQIELPDSSRFHDRVHPAEQTLFNYHLQSREASSARVRLFDANISEWRWHMVKTKAIEPGFTHRLFSALNIHEQVEAETFRSRERKEMIKKLEEQALEIERVEFTTNQFLNNMSHELRTPLTAVLGLSEALEVGLYGDCSDDQRAAFSTINECGKSLLGLINDILDVTKLETKKLTLIKERLTASEIANSVVRLHKKDAQEKKLHLKTTLELGDFAFQGDRKRIKQALSHLVSNAIKFTQPETEVEVEMSGEDGWVQFRVLDQGPGISPENVKRIFEPFSQLEEGLTRAYGGAGLGLNLVKKLVELMNGELIVEPRPNGGSIFGVRIPWESPMEQEREECPALHGEGLVYVVDDHQATSRLLCDTLSSWGFRVKSCDSVKSFKGGLNGDVVSLILMDGKLKDGNGLECIRWLREKPNHKETPVIFLTATQGDDFRRAGLEAGAQAYLEKPVELSQLSRCISALLNPETL